MKLLFSFIAIMASVSVFAQGHNRHVPWCEGPGDHSGNESTDCYGYAAARMYDRTVSSTPCPADEGPVLGNIEDGECFELVYENSNGISEAGLELLVDDLQIIKKGVIIEFSNHATYVSSIFPTGDDIYYRIRCDNKKSETDPHENGISLGDVIDDLPIGSNTPKRIFKKSDEWKVIVKNDFGSGQIRVATDSYDHTYAHNSVTSTSHKLKWEDPFDIWALHDDQIVNSYRRYFYQWTSTEPNAPTYSSIHSTPQITHKSDTNRPTWEGDYHKQFNFTFSNQFTGIYNLGSMEIGGDTYEDEELTETVFNTIELEDPLTIEFEALTQQFNGINYYFDYWETDPADILQSPYSRYQETSTSEHVDYKAHFIGKPTQVQNVQNVGNLYMPVHLTWSIHPNTNVSYKIYRRVRDQYGNETGPTLIGTCSHYNNSFYDTEYCSASSYILLLRYDVRAYYSVEQTSADEHWYALYGMILMKPDSTSIVNKEQDFLNSITESELAVFPNPFNPRTNIIWSTIKDGMVKAKIFDVTGRLIRTIYDDHQSKGVQVTTWDSKNHSGMDVPSGIYFLVINLPDKILKHKLILVR